MRARLPRSEHPSLGLGLHVWTFATRSMSLLQTSAADKWASTRDWHRLMGL
jgi:hypothetical protein